MTCSSTAVGRSRLLQSNGQSRGKKKKKKKNENCDGETDSHGEEETEDGPPAQILGENPADDLATDDVIVNRALENASLSK